MKSKLTKHILAVVIIAVALSVILAVSSFAAITGGYGTIDGLGAGTYKAASITLNSAGDGITTGTPFTLDSTTNTGLAGLYAVSTNDFANYEIVYVYGDFAKRQAIHDTNSGLAIGKYNQRGTFVPGKFTGAETNWANTTQISPNINAPSYAHILYDDLKYIVAGRNSNNTSLINSTFESLSSRARGNQAVYKYALTADEIIPVSEVKSYSFSTKRRYVNQGTSNVAYTDNIVKYVAYVMASDGTISQYAWLSNAHDFDETDDAFTVDFTKEAGWENGDRPTEGYFVGFDVYPLWGVTNVNNLTVSLDAEKTTAVNSRFIYNGYEIKDPDNTAAFGMSLVLDGKIGVKITETSGTVENLKLANVIGTEFYADFGNNNYAVFYIAPKDIATTDITFDVTYTLADSTQHTDSYTVNVGDYVAEGKVSPNFTEEQVTLITSFETYYNAVYAYFNADASIVDVPDLTALELADLTGKEKRSMDGTINGLVLNSTSLILEDDTTIRHYFEVKDNDVQWEEFTVVGGTDLQLATLKEGKEGTFVYTDIAGIASNQLSKEKTVTISDGVNTITVTFSALDYVDISLNDANVKLQNLVKALYRYSVESDNLND